MGVLNFKRNLDDKPTRPPIRKFSINMHGKRDVRYYMREYNQEVIAWMREMYGSCHKFKVRELTVLTPHVSNNKGEELPVKTLTRYEISAVPVTYAWYAPERRPTKYEGRKMTKREWKRANPPRFKAAPSGAPVPEIIVIGRITLAAVSLAFQDMDIEL